MLKVLISYDMQTGKEQECQDYFVNKFAPGLAKMGFRISDVWYTMWGDAPQILSEQMLPLLRRQDGTPRVHRIRVGFKFMFVAKNRQRGFRRKGSIQTVRRLQLGNTRIVIATQKRST